MTDWRECSVVRDKDGELWVALGDDSWGVAGDEQWYKTSDLERFGMTPVLDADGLPVVAELAKAIAEIAATTIYDPVTLAKACREWMLG